MISLLVKIALWSWKWGAVAKLLLRWSSVCVLVCVCVCFPDSESRGLSRRNDKSCGGKHQKVWCGTSVVRSHTVPGLLSLLWPPCHVASMRTKHPATVVSIQNQAALVIRMLFFLFFCYHKANRLAVFFFAWLLFSSHHVWKLECHVNIATAGVISRTRSKF